MLSILLIYFVYKYFRDLARKYKVKQEWKYSLTGVVAYFGFQFLFFFVWGVVEVINNPNYAQTDTSFNSGVGFLALLFGMLMLYFLHKYLEKRLQKQQEISPVNEIENIGVSTENE
jgi:membrane associated rhomboid family serine protease